MGWIRMKRRSFVINKPNHLMSAGRASVVAVAAAVSVLATAGPASADEKLITEKYIATEDCSNVGAGQWCPSNATEYWPTKTQFDAEHGSIKVEFTANPNHCSDIVAHVYFDFKEWGSNVVHPGQTDGGYEIPVDRTGLHQIAIQAQGLPGGCNTGALSAWGGTLRIWQLT
jgi:hypothetical protein